MHKKTILTLILALMTIIPAAAQTDDARQPSSRRGMRQRMLLDKEMCIQLYSLRDLIGDSALYAANHEDVFAQLSMFGYTSVEAAGYSGGKFYGVSPSQFKADVEAAGLTPLSSHTTRNLTQQELASHDFSAALKWWKQAISDHKAAGMTYIVTPWTNTPKTLEEAATICDYNNQIGQLCKDNGLEYGYHSHSHEFQKVEGQVWYDYFISHTDPELVFFQMDVYWAVMAQQSPVEWFKKYPGRFRMLHIKDKYEIGESGMVGFDAIFRNAETAGLRDYVVEIEGTDGTIDIIETVQRSSIYLNRQRTVQKSYSQKDEQ